MTSDPIELERLRQQLVQLSTLQHAARERALRPPRLTAADWRGPAFDAYSSAADRLAEGLRALAPELAHISATVRRELAHALG